MYKNQKDWGMTENLGEQSLIKVSKSRKQILKFSFEPKPNKNMYVFLP